jgi:glutamate 5-kinase
MNRKSFFKKAKRIVFKIGSGIIAKRDSEKKYLPAGGLDAEVIRRLVDKFASFHENGKEIILVSSGAVLAGRNCLNLQPGKTLTIPQKQAAAAIGQSSLVRCYESCFEKYGIKAAQILFTRDDFHNRRRFLNIRNTLETLLSNRIVPVINENDTVMVEEIKIGDNDTLSALSAVVSQADILVILSDVEGLYSSDPNRPGPAKAEIISTIEKITPEIEKIAGKSGGPFGIGGMYTKVCAAKQAAEFGIPTAIVSGLDPDNIHRLFTGENIGSIFLSREDRLSSRKHWIAHVLKPSGEIVVDEGAQKALVLNGRSLLATGIVEVRGGFGPGDSVSCKDLSGKEFARGLVNYNHQDLRKIQGMQNDRIEYILGYKVFDEVIHRNDLVILE